MPRGYGIAFIVHSYFRFLCDCFLSGPESQGNEQVESTQHSSRTLSSLS